MGWQPPTATDQILDAIFPKDTGPAPRKKAPESCAHEAVATQRLNGQVPHVDLGEHVIGSEHRNYLAPAINLDPGGHDMTIQMQIDGEGFDGMNQLPQVVKAMRGPMAGGGNGLAIPVGFRFAPTRAGAYSAMVTLNARWPDGIFEEQKVLVTARARKLEDPPEQVRAEEAKAKRDAERKKGEAAAYRAEEDALIAENATHDEPYKQNALDLLNDAKEGALTNIDALTEAQVRGIHFVAREAPKLIEGHEDESELWMKLGKLAIQIGTAAIAAVFAEAAGPAIVGLVSGVGASAAEESAKKVVVGMTAAIEDGMKLSVDLGYEAGAEEAKKGVKHHDMHTHVTAFFIAQERTVSETKKRKRDQLEERHKGLRPLLRSAPAIPAAAMNMFANAFDIAAKSAEGPQQLASASVWADYVAKTSHGKTKDGATNLEEAHVHGMKGIQPNDEPFSGALDIFVKVSGDTIQVHGARMFGVAHEVVALLLDADLKGRAFPIRLLLDGGGYADRGAGVITLDEHGVVHASGWAVLFGEGSGQERQLIKGAEQIASHVCGRTLAGWGIDRIETNDISKPQ